MSDPPAAWRVRFSQAYCRLEWFRTVDGEEVVGAWISGTALMQKNIPPWWSKHAETMKRLWDGGSELA